MWRTNFDRHLDDYVLTQIQRGKEKVQGKAPRPPVGGGTDGVRINDLIGAALAEAEGAEARASERAPDADVENAPAIAVQQAHVKVRTGPALEWPSCRGSGHRRACSNATIALQRRRLTDCANAAVQGSEEIEIEMPPPLSLGDLPPSLAQTLQHIVGKMDMMTQVLGMVEERLSLNEDKMAQLENHLLQSRQPPPPVDDAAGSALETDGPASAELDTV